MSYLAVMRGLHSDPSGRLPNLHSVLTPAVAGYNASTYSSARTLMCGRTG
jgi:hypothetical protein